MRLLQITASILALTALYSPNSWATSDFNFFESSLSGDEIHQNLEQLIGQSIPKDQLKQMIQETEQLISEPLVKNASVTTSSSNQKSWMVLYCAGVNAGLMLGGQYSRCTTSGGNAYSISALSVGAVPPANTNVGATVDLGVMLLQVRDGQPEGIYTGGQAGAAWAFVGGDAGLFVKIRTPNDGPLKGPANFVYRLRYNAGFDLELGIVALSIDRLN